MSNRDGFAGGFLTGVAIGGVVGGILGVVLASRRSQESPLELNDGKEGRRKHSPLEAERIEMARMSLEEKIAQLNDAIDDVRLQLDNVNGSGVYDQPEKFLSEDS